MTGTTLPPPDRPFRGTVNPLATDSVSKRSAITHPPADAPNVVVMLDDVGSAARAGWASYLDDRGRAVNVDDYFGRVIASIVATDSVAPGEDVVTLDLTDDGGGLGEGGGVVPRVDGVVLAMGRIDATVPFLYSRSAETLDVAVSTGTSVVDHPAISRFTGTVERIGVQPLSDLDDELAEAFGAGQAHGVLALH